MTSAEMESVFDMAKQYYPRLWPKERIEALVEAGKLTREKAEQIYKT